MKCSIRARGSLFAFWVGLTSCAGARGGADAGSAPAGGPGAAEDAAPASPLADSGHPGSLVLKPDADPNGLLWDARCDCLLVADDQGNRILRWTEASGFSLFKALPEVAPEQAGLGQLAFTEGGGLLVTRFGYGVAGGIIEMPVSGEPRLVPGLELQRRRIGLTVAPGGRYFDSWFVRQEGAPRVGAVGELTLGGAEVEVMTGLKKPVGVLSLRDSLYVSDQDLGQIVQAPLSQPSAYAPFATVPAPDLLSAGPDGSLITGGAGGNLYSVSSAGDVSILATGFRQVRGSAYDPKGERLFVADHDTDATDGVEHAIVVLRLADLQPRAVPPAAQAP